MEQPHPFGPTPSTLAALRLVSPPLDDLELRHALAECLAEAFSAGLWRATPMPLGVAEDPSTAHGILAGLGATATAVAAKQDIEGDNKGRVMGCVVGCIMDQRVVEGYNLQDFGAEPGDGLLAFIGITPEAQGARFHRTQSGRLVADPSAPSLARHLFQGWLDAPALGACPRLFVRTRRRIRAIRRLSTDNGFQLCGQFETEFRGQTQTRLVYRRDAAQEAAP